MFFLLQLDRLMSRDVIDLYDTKLRDWHLQKDPNFRWCAHVRFYLLILLHPNFKEYGGEYGLFSFVCVYVCMYVCSFVTLFLNMSYFINCICQGLEILFAKTCFIPELCPFLLLQQCFQKAVCCRGTSKRLYKGKGLKIKMLFLTKHIQM